MVVRTLYLGPIIHSLSLKRLKVIESALICVSSEGVIEWVEEDVEKAQLQEIAARHGVFLDEGGSGSGSGSGRGGTGIDVVELGRGEVLCPGMIDTHTVSLLSFVDTI